MVGVAGPGGADACARAELTRLPADDTGTVVLRLRGEVDISSVPKLQPELDRVLADAPDSIAFDLAELAFMDSSGIALLLGAAQSVGAVELRNTSTPIRRLIELSGLGHILQAAS
jgi:anti-sigma B factor antagonist